MESHHAKESLQFRGAEFALTQKLECARKDVSATEKQNAQIAKEQQFAESRISVLQRRADDLDSKTDEVVGRYNTLIQAGQAHLSFATPEIPSADSLLKFVHKLTKKVQSIQFPRPPRPVADLELEVREWSRKVSEKLRESDDRKASIAIYQNLIVATRKYHQLNVQRQGIEAELERENAERIREKQLREKLEHLKEEGKRQLNDQERKLSEAFGRKRMERDQLLSQRKSLQIEIEKRQSAFELARDAARNKMQEYQETMGQQNAEIEELERKLTAMKAALRLDQAVNTQKPNRAEMAAPRLPPIGKGPQPDRQPRSSARSTEAKSRLGALLKQAEELATSVTAPSNE
jgi:DNA repair exonuclease SbcCD ATPase subunit